MGVYEKKTLVAVFNFYEFKKLFLQFCIPPPFSPDCALLFSKNANQQATAATIITWLEEKSQTTNYNLVRFNFSYKHSLLFKEFLPKDFTSNWNHTYVLDISGTEDVQNLYAAKRRQQIRRAIKDGLRMEKITNMEIVFDLVKKTFDRQKKSIDEQFIQKILFEYANDKNSFAFASIINNKYSVVYFCIYHKLEAFYLLGGYDELLKHIGAGPLAMNACIEYAKKIGLTTFDFEGSMEPSIEKYFKEFGGLKKLYLCYEKKNKLGSLIVKLKKAIKG